MLLLLLSLALAAFIAGVVAAPALPSAVAEASKPGVASRLLEDADDDAAAAEAAEVVVVVDGVLGVATIFSCSSMKRLAGLMTRLERLVILAAASAAAVMEVEVESLSLA